MTAQMEQLSDENQSARAAHKDSSFSVQDSVARVAPAQNEALFFVSINPKECRRQVKRRSATNKIRYGSKKCHVQSLGSAALEVVHAFPIVRILEHSQQLEQSAAQHTCLP